MEFFAIRFSKKFMPRSFSVTEGQYQVKKVDLSQIQNTLKNKRLSGHNETLTKAFQLNLDQVVRGHSRSKIRETRSKRSIYNYVLVQSKNMSKSSFRPQLFKNNQSEVVQGRSRSESYKKSFLNYTENFCERQCEKVS